VWLLLNISYVATVPLMHRRFLCAEQRRWIIHDVSLPLAGALTVAGAAYWLLPDGLDALQTFLYLTGTGLAAVGAAAVLASEIRGLLLPYVRRTATPEAV
jgi:hypothetical protein